MHAWLAGTLRVLVATALACGLDWVGRVWWIPPVGIAARGEWVPIEVKTLIFLLALAWALWTYTQASTDLGWLRRAAGLGTLLGAAIAGHLLITAAYVLGTGVDSL